MLKLGNIVSEKELQSHQKVDYINYYVADKAIQPFNQLPTLFIGWKFFKKSHKIANILQKEIKLNHTFWDYSIDEEMIGYFNGIKKFVDNLPLYYIKQYFYYSLDFFNIEKGKEGDILSLLTINENSKAYIFKNEMIYLNTNLHIAGIDLVSLGYFDYDINTIIKLVADNVVTYQDIDGSRYQEFYKKFPEFGYLKRSMVFFHFS
jgi:hypothetical protein